MFDLLKLYSSFDGDSGVVAELKGDKGEAQTGMVMRLDKCK